MSANPKLGWIDHSATNHHELAEAKRVLDEINAAVSAYDPVLKEKARDILLRRAFGASSIVSDPRDTLSLRELFERWLPTTQAEYALLVVYFLQKTYKLDHVTGGQIASRMRRHGLALANVTMSTNENVVTAPPRIKKVKTPSGKNEYSLTQEGAEYVENRLKGVD